MGKFFCGLELGDQKNDSKNLKLVVETLVDFIQPDKDIVTITVPNNMEFCIIEVRKNTKMACFIDIGSDKIVRTVWISPLGYHANPDEQKRVSDSDALIGSMSMLVSEYLRTRSEILKKVIEKVTEAPFEVRTREQDGIIEIVSKPTVRPIVRMVKTKDLKLGPICRETLSQEQMERVKNIHSILSDYIENIDNFMADFCYDATPSKEIGIWEGIAKVIKDHLKELSTSEMRADACTILVLSTLGSEPKKGKCTSISSDLKKRLLDAYREHVISDEYLDAQEADIVADWELLGLNSRYSDLFKMHLSVIANIRSQKRKL
jgi:hypothetical protein